MGEYAWWGSFDENGNAKGEDYAHVVGQKKPNAWGLYDMHGNVWELCSDRFGREYYTNSPVDDPPGPTGGSLRVARGGSFADHSVYLRCANREATHPAYRVHNRGFRVVCER